MTPVAFWPGLVVSASVAADGALVIQIDGAPANDPDCERVRVYLNEAPAPCEDFCADCEGSTAPGTPDPHVCAGKE